MSVRFGDDLEIQNPIFGNQSPNKRPHSLGRSAGGQLFRYSKGVQYKRLRMNWTDLRETEMLALDAFFDSMNGPTTAFEFEDHYGTVFSSVCFTVDELPWVTVDDQVEGDPSTFTVGESECEYPTTTRKEPVYSLELELEILS